MSMYFSNTSQKQALSQVRSTGCGFLTPALEIQMATSATTSSEKKKLREEKNPWC